MPLDWSPLWLSLRVAGLATAVSLVLGVWLARRHNRGIETILSFLLALPPAIVLAWFVTAVTGRGFSWPIATLAALVYGVPFLVRSSRAALHQSEGRYENAARTLGAPEARIFWRISLPLALGPILRAVGIVFARILTEFAFVLVIAARWPHPAAPPASPVLVVIAVIAFFVAVGIPKQSAV